MKKLTIISLGCLALLTACLNRGKIEQVYTTAYVHEYREINDIYVSWSAGWLNMDVTAEKQLYNVFSSGADKEKFDQLCRKHSDNGYPHKYGYAPSIHVPVQSHVFFTPDISSIALTSEEDYDTGHPAGTFLNDLFFYYGNSMLPFIENGYKSYNWKEASEKGELPEYYDFIFDYPSEESFNSYPVFGPLSEISSKDLQLFGAGHYMNRTIGSLVPISKPDPLRDIPITFTFTTDDGTIYTATVTAKFTEE